MKPEQIIGHLKAVTASVGSNSPTPQLCSLQIKKFTIDIITDTNDLVQKIKKDFRPDSGWLTLQSEVIAFQNGDFPNIDNQKLINGEMVDESGEKSLHIRETTHGNWILTLFCEQDEQPATRLVDELSFLGQKHGDLPDDFFPLTYRRYWKLDEDFGYCIEAARFTGFHGEVHII